MSSDQLDTFVVGGRRYAARSKEAARLAHRNYECSQAALVTKKRIDKREVIVTGKPPTCTG